MRRFRNPATVVAVVAIAIAVSGIGDARAAEQISAVDELVANPNQPPAALEEYPVDDVPEFQGSVAVPAPVEDESISVVVEAGTSIEELYESATAVGARIVRVRYAGSSGVGEINVPVNATPDLITDQARALFAQLDLDVAPLEGAEIRSLDDVPESLIEPLAAQSVIESAKITERLTPAANRVAPPAEAATPSAASVASDWEPWFPSSWKHESSNVRRCTSFTTIGGPCGAWTNLASMNHSFSWGANGHSPALWPNNDFGLEIDLSLYNGWDCMGMVGPGWWANASTFEWVTSIPAAAKPYLDDNRASDECGRLSQAFGIGHPENIGTPYNYNHGTVILTPTYNMIRSSRYGAAMQIVHDDCSLLTLDPATWCMGLTAGSFPYGQRNIQLVNKSRYWRVPSCARMHDQWAAPIRWNNNATSPLLPSPLNRYETCLRNDYTY